MTLKLTDEQFEFLREAMADYHGEQLHQVEALGGLPYPISRRNYERHAKMLEKAETFIRFLNSERARQERGQ